MNDRPTALVSPKKNSISLLRQILLWTFFALILLISLAGGISFWSSYRENSDAQDDNLKNIATLLAYGNQANYPANLNHNPHQYYQTDEGDGLLRIDIWQKDIWQKNAPALATAPPINNSESLNFSQTQQIPVGMSRQIIDNQTWQVYRLDKGDSIIVVRQNSDFQDEMARNTALQSIGLLLFAMLIFFSILSLIMWRAFRPLKALSHQVEARASHDVSPLPVANLPSEILPFITAINQLLAKVKANMEKQQRFIADASHELRSPLTAISLQLQHLQRLADNPKIQTGLNKLGLRVQRNQDLVEQLLTLARLNAQQDNPKPTAIRPIIEQAIGLLLPIIDHKKIDLVLDIAPEFEEVTINADATALLLLIKNILQNAVLYTLEQGQVSVIVSDVAHSSSMIQANSSPVIGQFHTPLAELSANHVILQIIDTGHGIDPNQYQQAFEPFVRLSSQVTDNPNRSDSAEPMAVKGTGLGLAMVKSVCEQTGISLFLSPSIATPYNTSPHQGLCMTLVLP